MTVPDWIPEVGEEYGIFRGVRIGSSVVWEAYLEAEESTTIGATGGGSAIPAGVSFARVGSGSSASAVVLPAAESGEVVRLYAVAAFALRCEAGEFINGEDCGTAKEIAVAAGSLLSCTAVGPGAWIAVGHDGDGAILTITASAR